MSKTWKWILGIILVLVVLGALVAVGFAWRAHFDGATAEFPFEGREFGPMHRGNGGWEQPMMQGNQHYRMPLAPCASAGEGGRGFQSFGGGFFLLGGLVRLVFFGLLLYSAYWLGRRNARIALDPKPVARVEVSAAPEAAPEPVRRARAKKTE
jgi:hypothetical protein